MLICLKTNVFRKFFQKCNQECSQFESRSGPILGPDLGPNCVTKFFSRRHYYSGAYAFSTIISLAKPNTVNSEIFTRILFSRVALKDIFETLKIPIRAQFTFISK